MNRIIELVAMAVGGLSLFLVCFVGFGAMSGKDMSKVALIGRLFPAPETEGEKGAAAGAGEDEGAKPVGLSDSAVIEASLGVLSAWTLPSPYSTSELHALSEEIKKKKGEIEEKERALGRRERDVQEDEQELGERVKSLEELRTHLEKLKQDQDQREAELARREAAADSGEDARWAEVGRVIGGMEDAAAAAKRLQEYQPSEAAKILRSVGDEARAGEILNQVQGARWKEYVDAYTVEKARAGKKKS